MAVRRRGLTPAERVRPEFMKLARTTYRADGTSRHDRCQHGAQFGCRLCGVPFSEDDSGMTAKLLLAIPDALFRADAKRRGLGLRAYFRQDPPERYWTVVDHRLVFQWPTRHQMVYNWSEGVKTTSLDGAKLDHWYPVGARFDDDGSLVMEGEYRDDVRKVRHVNKVPLRSIPLMKQNRFAVFNDAPEEWQDTLPLGIMARLAFDDPAMAGTVARAADRALAEADPIVLWRCAQCDEPLTQRAHGRPSRYCKRAECVRERARLRQARHRNPVEEGGGSGAASHDAAASRSPARAA